MKHTPKPWVCTLNGQVSRETAGGLMPVADTYVCTNTYEPSGEVVAANAKLISAAPDLLEACEGLRDLCRENTSDVETRILKHLVNVINPAIKKATE